MPPRPARKGADQPLAPALAEAGEGTAPPAPPSADEQEQSPARRSARAVLCVAGATPLDEAAIAMLAQLLLGQPEGVAVTLLHGATDHLEARVKDVDVLRASPAGGDARLVQQCLDASLQPCIHSTPAARPPCEASTESRLR